MSSSQYADIPVRLTAFVGRSFAEYDRGVWHELRDILDSLGTIGFRYEDAKVAQLRPVSQKVRELIERNEIYVGVLTRRHPIYGAMTPRQRLLQVFQAQPPIAWTGSDWVSEEIGYALGKNKPVLLLIEDGVSFPTSDLDADTQWIPFRRANVQASQTEISEMILGLIAKRVVSAEATAPIAVAPTSPTPSTDDQPPKVDDFVVFDEHVRGRRFADAATVQEKIVLAEGDSTERRWVETFLLGFRARHGDTKALDILKSLVRSDPQHVEALEAMAAVYVSFKDFKTAAELLMEHVALVAEERRSDLAIRGSQALRKDNRFDRARDLLVTRYHLESDETIRLRLVRELARVAQDKDDLDLEAALLEKFLVENPTDGDERFRLGYVYGESERQKLSAHHYALVTRHADWPGAKNNLAVAYGALGLKAMEIKELDDAGSKYQLAHANLASLFADAGFTLRAKELAMQVLSSDPEAPDRALAVDRARYVLDEVAKSEKAERETAGKFAEETKREREFMAAYADAYCAPRLAPFTAKYETGHGEIAITCSADKLLGQASFDREVPVGALAGLLHSALHQPPKPRMEKVTLTITGQVYGCAATFELSISTDESVASLIGDGSRKITGLLVVEEVGATIRALGREGTQTELRAWSRKI